MSTALRPSLLRRIGNSWRGRKQNHGAVDLSPDGLAFMQDRRTRKIRWDDVIRIDAGTRDTLTIDMFFAVFRTANAEVTVDEFADGFRVLEEVVFERWPQLRERWVALQCGPLHQPQYETLWQR